MLLLGCGDARNALLTTGRLQQLGARSTHLHLNDISPVVLARNALLLAVAAAADVTSSHPGDVPGDDLQFLWALWYNARLSSEHRQRLNHLLDQVGPIVNSTSGESLQ